MTSRTNEGATAAQSARLKDDTVGVNDNYFATCVQARGNTTNSNQQIISLNALARAHYRRSIGTRGGAQASAAD
ncbi:hypothetical protein T492DRAFT_874008 [Pavlovales sp. CCMP2436]|nr:hypothetical protein T492DRAFT_874008 [Pavlovales sp. CCMP2436]